VVVPFKQPDFSVETSDAPILIPTFLELQGRDCISRLISCVLRPVFGMKCRPFFSRSFRDYSSARTGLTLLQGRSVHTSGDIVCSSFIQTQLTFCAPSSMKWFFPSTHRKLLARIASSSPNELLFIRSIYLFPLPGILQTTRHR